MTPLDLLDEHAIFFTPSNSFCHAKRIESLDEVKGIFVVVNIYLRGRHYVFINTVGANAKVQTL
jgi:hypothetical protein